jgi:hypothetical protein
MLLDLGLQSGCLLVVVFQRPLESLLQPLTRQRGVAFAKYHIQFDDGSLLECFSNRLHMESSSASIPPDALPVQPNVVNANAPPHVQEDLDAAEEKLIEAIKDSHEEEEHIVPPEHNDDDSTSEEHVAPEGGGESTQPAAEVDPNGQMPGQLPTAAVQVEKVRTYAQRKERAKGKGWQLLEQVGTRGNNLSMQPNGDMEGHSRISC